jgi:extracellular factor (EF) 3-hydroxypalmitic acid methyl ester biosynthesis protein
MKTANDASLVSGSSSPTVVARERRSRRLRSNRWSVSSALYERVRAKAVQSGLGELDASVLDLSLHGVRLGVHAALLDGGAILLGDRLDPLTIHCDGEVVYRGAGTVTRTLQSEHHMELGVSLEQAAVDLGRVHALSARSDVSQRWAQALDACQSRVAPPFRTFVSELASYLETAKSFLDREELAMANWDRYSRETLARELVETVHRDLFRRMEWASGELTRLASGQSKEQALRQHAYFEEQLGRYFDCSPFIHRAKKKPLGYAGDYEMMNMLYREHAEGATLFGKVMNLFATNLVSARANINRIGYIGEQLRAAIAKSSAPRVRIASIGCGPAQEIWSFLSKYPELGSRLDVALIDQEERAIAHCERTLAPLAAATHARIRVIKESARRLLTDRKLGMALGECDLIYSAGLFDYLGDRSFGALLHVLYGALKPTGRLLVGNVAAHNPDRHVLEYLTEWYLYHRSPEELRDLARALTPAPAATFVDAEPTGINLFLCIDKAEAMRAAQPD